MDNNIVIFDLGGVLYDIDKRKFERTFKESLEVNVSYEQLLTDSLFYKYETGKISTREFLQELKRKYFPSKSYEQIKNIWNSILVGNNKDSENVVKSLKDKGFTLTLLSNTNELHYSELYKTAATFLDKFDKIFLSYEIGLTKPSSEIYRYVLDKLYTSADKVVFIDDSEENVLSARKLGIKAYLHSGSLWDILKFI